MRKMLELARESKQINETTTSIFTTDRVFWLQTIFKKTKIHVVHKSFKKYKKNQQNVRIQHNFKFSKFTEKIKQRSECVMTKLFFHDWHTIFAVTFSTTIDVNCHSDLKFSKEQHSNNSKMYLLTDRHQYTYFWFT